jgi:hypothetical protein
MRVEYTSNKPWIGANALIVFFAFLIVCVGGGCAHESAKPIVTATPSAPNVASTPCPFFADMYTVSAASFVAHRATSTERNEILRSDAKVSTQNRKYVRWMRRWHGLIVFVANPNYVRNPSGPTWAWMALNTNIAVDPVQCQLYAVPNI